LRDLRVQVTKYDAYSQRLSFLKVDESQQERVVGYILPHKGCLGIKLVEKKRKREKERGVSDRATKKSGGWMAINIFFLRPPLFSIGMKEDSAPLVAHHPTARNLTLCKQPERKKETGYINRQSGIFRNKKARLTVRLFLSTILIKKKTESKKARCTVQSRVYV